MKKHLTSIESTRPAQQKSLFSYNQSHYNNNTQKTTSKIKLINHKKQIQQIFNTFQQLLSLRSYLVYRDLQQIYSNSQQFFQHFLNIYSTQQLYQFAFQSKSKTEKLYQKDQIQFFVSIIFKLNNQRHQVASNSKMKQFELLKQLIQYIKKKTIKYQQLINQFKQKKQIQIKQRQFKQKQKDFDKFQTKVMQNLTLRHQKIKSTHFQKINQQQQQQQNQQNQRQQKLQNKTKPSKLLSQTKQLSLRVKLSPYASQLKRQYDFTTLKNRLSKTIDLDLQRKVAIMDKMKSIQREKRNRQHKKRYSVMQDRLKQQETLTQLQLLHQKSKLQKSYNNQHQHLLNSNKTKKNTLITSLKNSFNAFNMHSDTKQIRNIIRHHRTSLQFETDINEVGTLRTMSLYEPKYSTLTYNMNQPSRLQQSQQQQKQRQQKRILRRFSKPGQNIQQQIINKNEKNINFSKKSQQFQFDLINNNIKSSKIKREKSLVALYDDCLEQKIK